MEATGQEARFRAMFAEEAEGRLATLSELLLELERDGGDQELLSSVFREAHTLKGGAAVVGLDEVMRVAHAMEEVLEGLRGGGGTATQGAGRRPARGRGRDPGADPGGPGRGGPDRRGRGDGRRPPGAAPGHPAGRGSAARPTTRGPARTAARGRGTAARGRPLPRPPAGPGHAGAAGPPQDHPPPHRTPRRAGPPGRRGVGGRPAGRAAGHRPARHRAHRDPRAARAHPGAGEPPGADSPGPDGPLRHHRRAAAPGRPRPGPVARQVGRAGAARPGDRARPRRPRAGRRPPAAPGPQRHRPRHRAGHRPAGRRQAGPRHGQGPGHAARLGGGGHRGRRRPGHRPGTGPRAGGGRRRQPRRRRRRGGALRHLPLRAVDRGHRLRGVGPGRRPRRRPDQPGRGPGPGRGPLRAGDGSEFRLSVPITLAVLPCLLVGTAGRRFAIPMQSVVSAEAAGGAEDWVEGQVVIRVRDQILPVADLAATLDGADPADAPAGDRPAVVVASMTRRHAFRVDALLGQRNLVVKDLGRLLPRLDLLAGAALEPDGSILLVLDVSGLVDRARWRRSVARSAGDPQAGATAPVASPAPVEPPSVLVVDDTAVVRELERSILEEAGYRVRTARDGREALAALAGELPDLVVTDVDMPNLDGLELTRAIRADRALAGLPVVVVTSKAAEADRRRAMDAGADAYLVKGDLDQRALLRSRWR